ncbi:hypothetical protein BESB_019060 [Besnoitia besnoiti]|uniref:Transmembrane protein n=1 Tax=Besnoitia besnoiti TaxID=94643 RepID=A0A2A9M1V2_BESBE|nr:hypothetical protein BESB_019060 [Besnoitia besnoiti]PFH31965.1 hypothetical protein BESB_019060 [Besnoitia besnoiti]
MPYSQSLIVGSQKHANAAPRRPCVLEDNTPSKGSEALSFEPVRFPTINFEASCREEPASPVSPLSVTSGSRHNLPGPGRDPRAALRAEECATPDNALHSPNDSEEEFHSPLRDLPSPSAVLTSCGAVVLTWLQDPLLTLVASATTAAAPAHLSGSTLNADSQGGEIDETSGRNVAVAAIGASGQLCDGIAALTIGIGISTAVLCSSVLKANISSSEAATETGACGKLSDSCPAAADTRSVSAAYQSEWREGTLIATRDTKTRHGCCEPDSATPASSPDSFDGVTGLRCLRTCIVGVWISAYMGALLAVALWWIVDSLLSFFFAASSSRLLLVLTRTCVSIRLHSLPFAVVSLTAKAALLALRDPLPVRLSAAATAASIPLLLMTSVFAGSASSSENRLSPMPLSLTSDRRSALLASEAPLSLNSVADDSRIRASAFAIVFIQIAVAILLLLRLLHRTMAATSSRKHKPAESAAEEGPSTKAVYCCDTWTAPNPCLWMPEETRDDRNGAWELRAALLRPPSISELQEFSPFLAGFLIQSTVRVVLYSAMMKVAASWGVKALAAHQVASSVYTVHGLPCEALTQVAQSVIHKAETLASAGSSYEALPDMPSEAVLAEKSAGTASRNEPSRTTPEAILPVTAALEGLLLHAKRVQTIACAYLVSLPLPLALLLHSHIAARGVTEPAVLSSLSEENHADDIEPASLAKGGVDLSDLPVYGAALVWILPLAYNLGRAGVYGVAWCRARYEAEAAEQKGSVAAQGGAGDDAFRREV